jgi:hypothetical protein
MGAISGAWFAKMGATSIIGPAPTVQGRAVAGTQPPHVRAAWSQAAPPNSPPRQCADFCTHRPQSGTIKIVPASSSAAAVHGRTWPYMLAQRPQKTPSGTSRVRFACPLADIDSYPKECVSAVEEDMTARNCPSRCLTSFTPNQL